MNKPACAGVSLVRNDAPLGIVDIRGLTGVFEVDGFRIGCVACIEIQFPVVAGAWRTIIGTRAAA